MTVRSSNDSRRRAWLPKYSVERATPGAATEVSAVALRRPGMRRTICVEQRPRSTVLVIRVMVHAAPVATYRFGAHEVVSILRAIETARGSDTPWGLHVCDRSRMSGGGEVRISAHRQPTMPPTVLIAGHLPDGVQLGRGTSISGAELEALERACLLVLATETE